MKRFYKSAAVEAHAGGWSVALDARPVKTPGKRPLILPTKDLAAAIAGEWNAQGQAEVIPDTMPLTQYACSALDRVAPARGQVIKQVSAYAQTDLMSYPAQEPAELRADQDALWLTLLADLRAQDWHIQQTTGLMAIDQGPDVASRTCAWLESKSDMALTALASLIETSGSFFLGYALAEGMRDIEAVIAACTIEERFNLRTWGADEESEQLLARRESDLRSASQMLDLL